MMKCKKTRLVCFFTIVSVIFLNGCVIVPKQVIRYESFRKGIQVASCQQSNLCFHFYMEPSSYFAITDYSLHTNYSGETAEIFLRLYGGTGACEAISYHFEKDPNTMLVIPPNSVAFEHCQFYYKDDLGDYPISKLNSLRE